MAISLSSLKKKTADAAPISLIYGVPGVGKTSLAAEWPAPVFANVGDGESPPAGIEITAFPEIKNFADMLEVISTLYSEEHDFKTLVIDSLGAFEPVVQKEACRRNNWQTIEDPGFGKGYVAAEIVWREFVEGINALRKDKGMGVVMLGHCDISRFDSPVTDPYSRYRVNLHKKAADLIEANCDFIGFVNFKASIKKADVGFNKQVSHAEGGGSRFIYTEERPGFIAKNRYNMPAEVMFKKGEGYAALAKFFPQPAA